MEIKHYAENEFNVDGVILYDNEFIVYANCLAEECNKHLGTNFNVDKDAIKRNQHQVFGNSHTPKLLQLEWDWNHREVRITTTYTFEDLKFPCHSSWGWYEPNSVIELCKMMLDYIPTMKQISKEKLTAKYDFYDRIGIGYVERPNYFDTL